MHLHTHVHIHSHTHTVNVNMLHYNDGRNEHTLDTENKLMPEA